MPMNPQRTGTDRTFAPQPAGPFVTVGSRWGNELSGHGNPGSRSGQPTTSGTTGSGRPRVQGGQMCVESIRDADLRDHRPGDPVRRCGASFCGWHLQRSEPRHEDGGRRAGGGRPQWLAHDRHVDVGCADRMSDLVVAVRRSQLRTLDAKTSRRREIEQHAEICADACGIAGWMRAPAKWPSPGDGRVFRGRPEEVR